MQERCHKMHKLTSLIVYTTMTDIKYIKPKKNPTQTQGFKPLSESEYILYSVHRCHLFVPVILVVPAT